MVGMVVHQVMVGNGWSKQNWTRPDQIPNFNQVFGPKTNQLIISFLKNLLNHA